MHHDYVIFYSPMSLLSFFLSVSRLPPACLAVRSSYHLLPYLPPSFHSLNSLTNSVIHPFSLIPLSILLSSLKVNFTTRTYFELSIYRAGQVCRSVFHESRGALVIREYQVAGEVMSRTEFTSPNTCCIMLSVV